MLERFTDRARSTVTAAQTQARRFGHGSVGTEHLLLALLAEPDEIATGVLNAMGVSAASVAADVLQIGGSSQRSSIGYIPLTERARSVLRQAPREAQLLKHGLVWPEHVLLAILRDDSCVAAAILLHAGITLDTARDHVLAQLGSVEFMDDGLFSTYIFNSHTDIATARQVQLRVEDDEIHLAISDAATVERAKRIVLLAGGPVTGEADNAHILLTILETVRHGLFLLEGQLAFRSPPDRLA
jgi:ATP-dependent Clp protease ATP-binding subunit ClpC